MNDDSLRPIRGAVQSSWLRFLDVFEPLRPDLYRYCRHLGGSPWEAEDVSQDTLARAFVMLACLREMPENPRAWLFRVASNVWINQKRRGREIATEHVPEGASFEEPRLSREGAGTLISRLSPQERAAVVLKDVFDFSLAEIATTLTTTVGAVKAAIHRGREKLSPPEPPEDPPAVTPAVLDAFCSAFNARDIDGLTALLLDTSTVELPGLVIETGKEEARRGTFHGTLFGCAEGTPRPDADVAKARAEVRWHRGEPIMLWWSGSAVHTVVRARIDEGKIASLVSYYHSPHVLEEICKELAVPFETHGYRYFEGAVR